MLTWGGNPINRIDPKGLDFFDDLYDAIVEGQGPLTEEINIPSVGDMVSEPNGNIWPGFQPQDGVCSLPWPAGPLADKCVLDRCQSHDECYEDSECNASSWISNALGGTKSCNECNSGFFE